MSEQTITPATEVSFKDFLFKNKRNRTILKLAAVVIAIQLGIFKYLYPYTSFIHGDSFSYLTAAHQNLNINTYLIGYSKFLRLFSVFTNSDFALMIFQYIFIQCSVLFLLFSTFYFYRPGKLTQTLLLCFMVFNPLFLHLANLVSSDAFFLAVSMIWFTLLLWIIYRPSNRIAIWQVIILFIAFTVRYNALIYPLITAGAFWLSKWPIRNKLIGFASSVLLCGSFIGFTSYHYNKLTGYLQYSPFSGWQLANNAMYAYRYVKSVERKPVPKKFQALDNMVRQYFDTTRNTNKFIIEKIQASTYYMWSPGLPLMKYRNSIFKKDTVASELKKWASMGPLYKSYGLYIIRQYPWQFTRYFIWPNTKKYYAPPVEFLEEYNSGKNDVTVQAKTWFGYKSRIVKTRMKNNKVWILDFYPILSGIINLVMVCTLFCYALLKGWQYNVYFYKGVLLASIVWLLNAGFTIFASSSALRFQSFPIILTTIFVVLLVDWIAQLMINMRHEKISTIRLTDKSFQEGLAQNVIA